MAGETSNQSRTQPSRLQRIAPASIQITRAEAAGWNIAIPLLSPLVISPIKNLTAENNSKIVVEEKESKERLPVASPVFMRWQHPASPFCYQTASPAFSFTAGLGAVDTR